MSEPRPRPRVSKGNPGSRPATQEPTPPSSRGERRRRTRRVKKESEKAAPNPATRLLFGAAMVMGMLLAGALTYVLVVYPRGKGPGTGGDVEVTFEKGESTASVIAKLASSGLLASRPLFGLYARLIGLEVEPGKHLLVDDTSPEELVRRLERRGTAQRAKVVVPEGFTRFDIAKRLQATHVCASSAFLEASADPALLHEIGIRGASAEGYLFPATYEFHEDSDPRDLVRRMKSEFDKRFLAIEQNHHLGMASLENGLGWGVAEVLTLASMVEKEAAVDEERPIIASVFLNRLRDPSFKRHVLQCDPTAGYGCLVLRDRLPSCAGYAGKITHAINVDPLNTYSTYVHEGLPPGPIANPGMKSIQAVVAPANTKYLYFVAREGRRHAFSENLDEHNTAVKDLRERTTRDVETH